MTFHVMSPTFDQAWSQGLKPLLDNEINEQQAFERISDPFRDFMMKQVRPQDLALFDDLNEAHRRDRVEPVREAALPAARPRPFSSTCASSSRPS